MQNKPHLRIRRALLSVSDKDGIVDLAQAMVNSGAEIIATGRTAQVLREAGLSIVPIEGVSGSPEAFQGRMKTLSFPVFSGILYRRGDSQSAQKDQEDLKRLGFGPIDAVVVNFYPFERAAEGSVSRESLIEEVDIGGPALVRAAAKNSPDVLVLTDPSQYAPIIEELGQQDGISRERVEEAASQAWNRVLSYDEAIAKVLGSPDRGSAGRKTLALRYGENPHQSARLEIDGSSPLLWELPRGSALSYNNILDVSSGYSLAAELMDLSSREEAPSAVCVIVKHNNPCGVAQVRKSVEDRGEAIVSALELAWNGDSVSAFGGVVVLSEPLHDGIARFLEGKFIEVIAAPEVLRSPVFEKMALKKKNLRAVEVRDWSGVPGESLLRIPGGILHQTSDRGLKETLRDVTEKALPEEARALAGFGIAVTKTLKSNAVALVRWAGKGSYQLVGAGQGQPNRVEALKWLAIPRARRTLQTLGTSGPSGFSDCLLVSDAFFPFRDTVDEAQRAGIRWIVQPGGSVRDQEVIQACNELGIAMAFTGVRHFRH